MVGTSKILTVSYGTFSCTLEGFDDPFSTMRGIAEYFRDLAADDRYFGAEPPTPDAEMLQRIAEREIQRRVIARVGDNGLTLTQAGEGGSGAEAGTQPADQAAAAPEQDEASPSRGRQRRMERARARARAEGNEGPEGEAEAAPQPAPAAATTTAPRAIAAPDPLRDESVAARMLRIRAAVAQSASREGFDDNGNTDSFFATRPIGAAFSGSDTTPAPARAPESTPGPAAEPTTDEASDDKSFDDADTADRAVEDLISRIGQDQLRSTGKAPAAGTEEDDADETHADDTGSWVPAPASHRGEALEPEAEAEEPAQRPPRLVRARVVRMRRIRSAEDDAGHSPADAASRADDEEPFDLTADTPEDAADEDMPRATRQPAEAEDRTPAYARGSTLLPEEEADLMKELAALRGEEPAGDSAEEATGESMEKDAPADGAGADHIASAEADAEAEAKAEDRHDAGEASTGTSWQDAADEAEEDDTEDEDHRQPRDLTAAETEAGITAGPSDEDIAARAAEYDLSASRRTGRSMLDNAYAGDDDDSVNRILAETNHQLDDSEASRRRSTIAHLKAAVAATRADREDGRTEEDNEEIDLYRSDLERVVRPRRPDDRRQPMTIRRMAPLMLVSEQRIDLPKAAPADNGPVQPRRITAGNLALMEHEAEPEEPEATLEGFANSTTFIEYVEKVGARQLPDLLEAAAAFAVYAEGRPHFSRPQLMRLAQEYGEGFAREDGLRAFGTLLRNGRILKHKRGQFTIASGSRFQRDA